jgi:hypothetical protein
VKQFFFSKQLAGAIAMIALVASLVWISSIEQDCQDFHDAFGVSTPWYPSLREKAQLQVNVTERLSALTSEVEYIDRFPCGKTGNKKNDDECSAVKTEEAGGYKIDLAKARAIAEKRGFDIGVSMCPDGRVAVNGLCWDGSVPVSGQ